MTNGKRGESVDNVYENRAVGKPIELDVNFNLLRKKKGMKK
ncbi:hypothetical protein [Paenibacillus planticolens]|nr:hypothetical protein [Paenibacillus planticolens]